MSGLTAIMCLTQASEQTITITFNIYNRSGVYSRNVYVYEFHPLGLVSLFWGWLAFFGAG
jgi:hypothetical protein